MASIGYALSSEEHGPASLVRSARLAEEAGFAFAMISDHYHPWISAQGHSPFVWSVLGGIAQVTERIQLGTGVTAPLRRTHPAVVAHAAATVGSMMPGRFFLGVGSGENLNEHIFGDRWPAAPERLERLREAIEIIKLLWRGGERSHRGQYYTVEYAQIYDLPDPPPPVLVASTGPRSAGMAAEVGDGLIGLAPQADLLRTFDEQGGRGKPRIAKMTVSWAESDEAALRRGRELWPNEAMGAVVTELRRPRDFEAIAPLVSEVDVTGTLLCAAGRDAHLQRIREFLDAGFDHVYVHQVGGDQEAFIRFYASEILPEFEQQPIEFSALGSDDGA